jgi:hypothetical protein
MKETFAILQPIGDQSQCQRLHGRRRLLPGTSVCRHARSAAMSASQRPSSSRKYSIVSEKPVGDFGMNPSWHRFGSPGSRCGVPDRAGSEEREGGSFEN